MAELGIFTLTVLKDKSVTDTAQVPASSTSVKLYKEGAWANGTGSLTALQSGATITVHDAGGFIVNDFVTVGTDDGSTMKAKVTAVTATTLTVDEVLNNANFTWADGDRIVNLGAALLTIYSDDASAESITNPLTTSATGFAFAYVDEESVDYLISGTGVTTTLFSDEKITSEHVTKSNVVDSATAIGHTIDTVNTLATAGAKILSLQTGGTEEFYVDKDGDVWTDSGVFASDVANSGTNIAFDFNSVQALTGTTKLFRLTNNTVEKWLIEDDGAWTSQAGGTIVSGGLTITAGGLTVSANGASITGDLDVNTFVGFQSSSELTISAGVVTATRSIHTIDTESDAVNDDLDTINGGNEGDILIIGSANLARDVTIPDSTGNIRMHKGVGFTLSDLDARLFLIKDSSGNWLELGRSHGTLRVIFSDGDTTPSVRNSELFRTNNTGATSITAFDDAQAGQIIRILVTDNNTTIVDGSTLTLAGNFGPTNANSTITLYFESPNWYELSRSAN